MDDREFEAKVLEQIDTIRRIGRRRLSRALGLDDFTHEVVVRLYAAREQLRDEKLLPGWAAAVARNLAIEWNNKRVIAPESVHTDLPGPPRPDYDALQAERWQALVSALSSLEPVDRDLLVSYYVDELGYSELQRRHGLSYSAVGVRLHRVKRKLRKCLRWAVAGSVALFHVPNRRAFGALPMGISRARLSLIAGFGAALTLAVGHVWIVVAQDASTRDRELPTTEVVMNLDTPDTRRMSDLEKRLAQLKQPDDMKTPDYRHGVDPVDGNDAWELMMACGAGDIETVKRLIAKDIHLVNAQYSYQFPIHFAVREGHPRIVQFLLDNGAEPGRSRFMYDSWQKLLPEARQRGYDDVVAVLESTLNARYGYDPEFDTMAEAMRNHDRAAVQSLLAKKPHLATAADVRGNTAIHWAVMTDMRDLVGQLMGLGADVNAHRADGSTPILLAVNHDYWYSESRDVPPDIVDFLLESGADYPLSIAILRKDGTRIDNLLRDSPDLATQLNPARQSHLYYAARSGQPEVIEQLLALDADPNMPEDLAPAGRALFAGAEGSQEAIVRLLLEHGADANGGVDSSGSPYSISLNRDPNSAAARSIRELLVSHGAVVPIDALTEDVLRRLLEADGDGSTASRYAKDVVLSNDPELLRVLLSHDPSVLALPRLVTRRFPTSPECMDLLFQHGLDASLADTFGRTWFHFIVGRGYMEVAQRFLAEGADINAVDPVTRETPLAVAAQRGDVDMALFLLDAGADPNLPEDRWARPIARAVVADNTDMMTILREHGASD